MGEDGFLLWSVKRKSWLRWRERFTRWLPFIKDHAEAAYFPIAPIPLLKEPKTQTKKKGK